MTDLLRCSEVAERLPLYVGGDLEPEGLERVHRHLAECEPCARELQVVSRARRALIGALRAEGELPAPGDGGLDLWPALRAELAREGRLGTRTERSRPAPLAPPPAVSAAARGRLLRWPKSVAAAAAAVLFVVWGAGHLLAPGPSGSPVAPASTGGLVPGGLAASRPSGTLVPARAGGLRRLAPGEASLGDSAESLDVLPAGPFVEVPAVRPWADTTTVVGYR